MLSRGTSQIEVARKVLHRRSLKELEQGSVLSEAIELALQTPSDTNVLERLSYTITLLRQLVAAVSQIPPPTAIVDNVHRVIGPALQPRGTLTTLLMTEMSSRVKPHPVRATETFNTAARLAAVLPPPSTPSSSSPYLLQALFNEIVRGELGSRANLLALSTMLESVPLETVPSDLLGRLLADFSNFDSANIRCEAIATLLLRQRDAGLGSDAEKDGRMFGQLLGTLGEDDDNGDIVKTFSRYLLPTLLKGRREAFPTLLNVLSSDDKYFAAWIAAASYGVSSGIIGIDRLPAKELQEALEHEDCRIRILGFQLVAMNKSVLEPHVMDLVVKALQCNDIVTQAGGRTDMGSAIYAFLTHLKAMEHVAAREAKKAKSPEAAAKAQIGLETSARFHNWFLKEYLTPAIGDSRALPPHRAIFGLRKLLVYLDVYSDRPEIVQAIYSPELIDLLLACQASEFTETRVHAKNIISMGPTPLPGYESLDSPASKKLMASARASINHSRRTQADAGLSALSILFTKLVQPAGQAQAVAFVTELADLLEKHIIKSEENLATGIVEYPLYGLIGVITELIRNLDLKTQAAQDNWTALLHRLSALVDRVWVQTRKVISLGPSDVDDKETAAHEIARAYEVMGDGDEDGDESMDHTNLLSGCWRATKEAAELLAVLVITPVAALPEQTVWTKEEVGAAGRQFLTWLHEIRHVGTFSRISSAFGHLVEAVKARKELHDLVDDWVERNLQAVAQGHLVTLRRSAALPYSFLALVSGDRDLLDLTVGRLVDMAKLNNPSSDVTKVHAMNCLKTILLDAKQTRFLSRYFERVVMVALAAFGSSNWNVRNVGLMLFSTITHRSLAGVHSQEVAGTRSALSTRQTLASWHAMYPSIVPHIADYLRTAYRQGPASLTEHSPLFPILIILRSLRWSPEGARTADFLYPVVERYLANVEWQVREVASQALSSLLSPESGLEKAKVTATRVSHESEDYNLVHGRLLFLRRLLADVVPWGAVEDNDKKLFESRLLDALHGWAGCKVAVVTKGILDCINEYATQTAPLSPTFLSEAKRAANGFLLTPSSYAPGIDLLHESAAATILIDATPKDVLSLLEPTVPEDAQLAALDHVDALDLQTPEVLSALVKLCNTRIGNAVRAKIFDVLSVLPPSPAADKEIAKLVTSITGTVQKTRYVPLREAALGALGRATVAADIDRDRLADLASRVEAASNERKSHECRASALHCMEQLTPLLFGSAIDTATHASLQRTLLRLMEDDDEEIRLAAAQIVCAALGPARPILSSKAVSLWWDWLARQPSTVETERWLWEVAMDQAATNAEIAALAAPAQSEGSLFVEEAPNMYRNPVWDASSAATVLAQRTQDDAQGRAAAQALLGSITAALAAPQPSPIDNAWSSRWSLLQRQELLARALGAYVGIT